jgi:hypothetical protein
VGRTFVRRGQGLARDEEVPTEEAQEKANVEALLYSRGPKPEAIALAFGGRRPKKPAQAAALCPRTATGREISHAREHRSSRYWRPTKGIFSTPCSVFETH